MQKIPRILQENLLELISEFSKVTGSIHRSVTFLYTNNEHAATEI